MSSHGPEAHGWPGDDLDVPPHSLDLDAIVQVGRRQVRHRRMAMVGGTAAVLAAVAAIPATVPVRLPIGSGDNGDSPASSAALPVLDCDITVLPLPEETAGPEPNVELAAMDPTGRYMVGNAHRQASGNADVVFDPGGVVLWESGRPTVPSPLRDRADARDVNAEGVVVGGGSGGYAWIYHDGQMSRLPTPDGYGSAEAVAINAAGDVVGTVSDDDDLQTVVVWPAGDRDNPRVLPAPPGQDVSDSGITDDGLVVGRYYGDQNGDWPADTGVYLWEPDGTRVELPVPEGAYDVYGIAVRGHWAIGQALTEPEGPQSSAPTGTSLSLRWDLRTRTLHQVTESGGVPNQVWDINTAGDMLFIAPPAVIRDGTAHALPDPIEARAITPPDTPDRVYAPMVTVGSISDDGSTISGEVYFTDSTNAEETYSEDAPRPINLAYPMMWRC